MFQTIVSLFDIFLYQPLFNALVLIYNYCPGHDFGIAIILLTLAIRVILYPVAVKSLNSQKVLQKIQPQIQEIQKKYKDDKEKLAKETLEIYRKEKINPFSGLFLALVQLPILIALYRVFWNGMNPDQLSYLYGFVANPVAINSNFLGLIDLSKANIAFAILAGILQFFQTKMMTPKNTKGQGSEFAAVMQKQMLYFFPFMTVVILLTLPSAIGLYWIVSGIFSIVQQYFLLKQKT